MESESSPPLFTVDHEIANFLVSCGILSKAWEESRLANYSQSYTLNEYEGVAYVAFPSCHKIEGFIQESKYGECNIQTDKFFSGCLKGNDDQPALVHQGALKLFKHIMENTDFQAKMQMYTDSKQRKLKPVIFVGHSLGGAIATLATLWVLEKRLRQSSPFCITFGCPFVGDVRLHEAVARENWSGNFCHVVSQHDVVPRMLLAPVEKIVAPLIAILPYWESIMANDSKHAPDSSIQDACRTLLDNVLQYTNTVANYGPDFLRELDGVIKRSPYRPFGTYMFCSSEGAACIDNSETVLKMLHFTMLSHENPYDTIVQDCFSEHIGYGFVLERVIEKSTSRRRSAKPALESSYKMGISLQLEAIGVGLQNEHAQIALQIARSVENKHNTNIAKLAIELSLEQSSMAELEWYKESCEKDDGIGYYDSFKYQVKKDIHANRYRRKLAAFWDDIIEKWEGHELPSDFQSQNKWINAGTFYRRLVEPLDIAHYYRMSKGIGNYILDGRPKRHKILQKWMEDKEKTRSSRGKKPRTRLASLTQDSCFWAHLEEALKDLETLKQQHHHQKAESLEKFEGYVTKMIKDGDISVDVFSEGSSFMEWWKEWKEYKQNQFPGWTSPLNDIMENESWKEYKKNQSPDWSSPLCQKMENPIASLGYSVMSSEARKTDKRNQWSPPSKSSSPSNNLTIDGFTVGQETAAFLASCEILSKAWEESQLANNSESFAVKDHGSFVYVAFPSFHKIESFTFKVNKYGEGNIQTDNKVFSDSLKGNDDKPALVHQGALKLFLDIMEKTDFQAQLQIYMDSKQRKLKPIIFVGHSLGGAVATLATLWVLEKRLRQSSPFCITFGSPLVGDVRLVEAVGRENWGGNFCHVVSKNDIVPRVLLAPFESTAEPLNALLAYWLAKITNDRNDQPDSYIQDAYNALLQSVRNLDTSPYRPFGTYMFCSSNGAACIANSETVLEMLHLTIQSQKTSSDISAQDCLLEHIRYDSVLECAIQNSTRGIRANSNSESSYEMGISLELEAVGIGAQNGRARNAIQKSGNIENKQNRNATKLEIELRQQQLAMAELEWYKERCDIKELFYYDSFKNREDDMHPPANRGRLDLGKFWDEVIQMWEKHELPRDFQSQNKWINAGTAYRRLVEPLDIADHYRTKGHMKYLPDERPNRHKVLQKWMEEKEKTSSPITSLSRKKTSSPLKGIPSLSRDSCFCAHAEEASKDFEHLQRGEYGRLKSLEEFEDYVTRMIKERGISSDVIARIRADSAPSSLHHLSSKWPLEVLRIKVSSPNTS